MARRRLVAALALCCLMMFPFLFFPATPASGKGPRLVPDLLQLWPAGDEWSAEDFIGDERVPLQGPPLSPESQRPIEEDPVAVQKRFQQVHVSIHNYEESYIGSIEQGRRGNALPLTIAMYCCGLCLSVRVPSAPR